MNISEFKDARYSTTVRPKMNQTYTRTLFKSINVVYVTGITGEILYSFAFNKLTGKTTDKIIWHPRQED